MTLEHHLDAVNRQLDDLNLRFKQEIADKEAYLTEVTHLKNLNKNQEQI